MTTFLLIWAIAATAAALFFAYRAKLNAALAAGKAEIGKVAGEVKAKL